MFDVIHGFERFLGHFETCCLIDARESRDGLLGIVEVLVVSSHVVGVGMRYGDVV